MSREEILAVVCSVVSRVFEIEQTTLDRGTQIPKNPQKQLLVLQALEHEHGIRMPSAGIETTDQTDQRSVQGFCNYVSCQLQKGRLPAFA